MTQCKEGSQRAGLMLDSSEELYKWFTQQVMTNLHVVLTMNPSSEGLKNRAATSPALFNRCVVNWFGDWSTGALYQVGQSFTTKIDLERSTVCQFLVLLSFGEFKLSDETFNIYSPTLCKGQIVSEKTHSVVLLIGSPLTCKLQ